MRILSEVGCDGCTKKLKFCFAFFVFCLHYVIIFYTLNPFSRFGGLCAIVVYAGWGCNENFCILSQIEYRFFGYTCMGPQLKPVSIKAKQLLLFSLFIRGFVF